MIIRIIFVKITEKDTPFIKTTFDEKDWNKHTTLDLSYLNDLPEDTFYNFLGSLTSPPFTVYFDWFMFNNRNVGYLTISDHTYRKSLTWYQNNRY
jgi:carbonic anhydrase